MTLAGRAGNDDDDNATPETSSQPQLRLLLLKRMAIGPGTLRFRLELFSKVDQRDLRPENIFRRRCLLRQQMSHDAPSAASHTLGTLQGREEEKPA